MPETNSRVTVYRINQEDQDILQRYQQVEREFLTLTSKRREIIEIDLEDARKATHSFRFCPYKHL